MPAYPPQPASQLFGFKNSLLSFISFSLFPENKKEDSYRESFAFTTIYEVNG
jgi:hypothetical protein